MPEIKFEIKQPLGILSEGAKNWSKEVNIVSWNDRKPKLDIREWDENHERMGKGITLNKEELLKLKQILLDLNVEEMDI
ncbi:MAG: PC4/YdbC family ssDNA-binding protein [bacterium]